MLGWDRSSSCSSNSSSSSSGRRPVESPCGSVGGIGRLPPRTEEHVGLRADNVCQYQGCYQHANTYTQCQHLEESKEQSYYFCSTLFYKYTTTIRH